MARWLRQQTGNSNFFCIISRSWPQTTQWRPELEFQQGFAVRLLRDSVSGNESIWMIIEHICFRDSSDEIWISHVSKAWTISFFGLHCQTYEISDSSKIEMKFLESYLL
jgi:hypothetical protein